MSDLGQREHELADAVLTLLIAGLSRLGSKDDADRLAVLEQVAQHLADGVAERVCALRGVEAGQQFRKALARRSQS